MSYAFVFLNTIVGVLSGLLRIAKAMILGLFFFSRLDRTVLMPGFQKWDKGKLPEKRMLRNLIPLNGGMSAEKLKNWATACCFSDFASCCFWFFFKLPKHLNNNATRHDGLEKGLGEGDQRILVVSQWNLPDPPIGLRSILMDSPPPPFNLHWQSICNSSSLDSVRDDWFPFRSHWKPFDHVQNPFSPSPARW